MQRRTDLTGQQAAQIAGMVAVGTLFQGVDHGIGGEVSTAVDRLENAAPAAHGAEALQRDMVLLQRLQDQPAAEGLLLGNGFELGQLLGRVVQVLLKQHLLVVKHADLGGRGAGIDGQNSVRHKTYLLYACIVCSFFNESIITPVKTSVNGIFHHFAALFAGNPVYFLPALTGGRPSGTYACPEEVSSCRTTGQWSLP